MTLNDKTNNPFLLKEVLITSKPELLKTIIDGIGNALAPYGGIKHGETLMFVGVVLGYAKSDPASGAFTQLGVLAPSANFTSVPASSIYDTAARQSRLAEDNIANEAKRQER